MCGAKRFARSAAEASREADVVQENIPERAELKASVLAEIDEAAAPEKIILSSTGGLSPSEMQRACRHPERLVVLHPFNPAHLIRLVEVVGGRETGPEVLDWAEAFARRMGKVPIRLNTEIPGHLTNRLQFALLREAEAKGSGEGTSKGRIEDRRSKEEGGGQGRSREEGRKELTG